MSDTSHAQGHSAEVRTEGDGVSYRGIVWFIVVLVVTTVACQLLMWGMLSFMNRQAAQDDAAAMTSMALPYGDKSEHCDAGPLAGNPDGHVPCITKDGQVQPGHQMPAPNLMADDPVGLASFRAKEEQVLGGYGVIDKNAGTYRIPVERAKALLMERGIPGGTIPPPAAPATPATVKK